MASENNLTETKTQDGREVMRGGGGVGNLKAQGQLEFTEQLCHT